MKKRRKRGRKQIGLAYWKELEAKGRVAKPTSRPGRCRDCAAVLRLPIADWRRRSGPKCFRCGGILDRLPDHGQGERP